MTNDSKRIIETEAAFREQDAARLDAALKRLLGDEDFRFVALWLLRTVCGLYDRVDPMTDHADFTGRHNAGIDIMEALNRADADRFLAAMLERNKEEHRRRDILESISTDNQGVNP